MSEVLTEESIIKLKSGVNVRYEHNFNGGAVVLINTIQNLLWFGNKETLDLVNMLKNNQNKSIGEIFSEMLDYYEEESQELVLESLSNIVDDLFEKGFLVLD